MGIGPLGGRPVTGFEPDRAARLTEGGMAAAGRIGQVGAGGVIAAAMNVALIAAAGGVRRSSRRRSTPAIGEAIQASKRLRSSRRFCCAEGCA
jgi:hypothetical protein